MHAIVLNATLKRSPEPSSAGALGEYVGARLGEHGVSVDHVRLADHVIEPGVVSEAVSEADEWPALRERLLAADNRVAGFVVVGNEDGAHHVIAELAQPMIDIGFTVPGQAWTYWNKGPGPGEDVYLTTADEERS